MSSIISSDIDINTALVIDNGSCLIKSGLSGNEYPSSIIPCYIGKPKHTRVININNNNNNDDNIQYIGDNAKYNRSICKLYNPLKNSEINNYDDMLTIYNYIYNNIHNIQSSEHPLLLTDTIHNTIKSRIKTTELCFESLLVPSLYITSQSILSLYSTGQTTGLIVNSGYQHTDITPIYNGYIIDNAVQRINIGGHNVIQQLKYLIQRETGLTFNSSSELEIVRDIAEKLCYVNMNTNKQQYDKLESILHNNKKLKSTITLSNNQWLYYTLLQQYNNIQINNDKCNMNDIQQQSSTNPTTDIPYKLPDGQIIHVGHATHNATELLFNPLLLGNESPSVQDLLIDSVILCDIDIRKNMYNNIYLCGGNTLYDNYGDRLCNELRQHNVSKDYKIKIYAPTERLLSPWVGGSLLTSLSTMQSLWVTKQMYDEYGSNIVYRNVFQ